MSANYRPTAEPPDSLGAPGRSQEFLDRIKVVFNPTVSDLARAMNVSRQEVYQWLEGLAVPDASYARCLEALSAAAKAFQEAGVVKRAPVMVKLRVFDGKSLLDLAAEDQLSPDHVEKLIAEAHAMESAYQRSGLRQVHGRPTDDWLSDISIPGNFV